MIAAHRYYHHTCLIDGESSLEGLRTFSKVG